eukprot:m.40359 g.40359  ORF g.40359 m.40359 type:complete len:572 (+) comp6921_c0_seq5:61-1776(+)
MTELQPPLNVRAKVAPNCAVQVRWDRPEGIAAYYFRLFMRQKGSEKWSKLAQEKDLLVFTTSSLQPITTYEFRVQSYSMSAGDGPFSHSIFLETAESVPSAPRNLKATNIQIDSIGIAWEPPSMSNGSVLSYLLYVDELGKDEFLELDIDGNTHSHYMRFLEMDTVYRFQVCALNAAGEGPLSTILTVRTKMDHRSRFLQVESKPAFNPLGMKAHTIRDVPSAPPVKSEAEIEEERQNALKERARSNERTVKLPSTWVPRFQRASKDSTTERLEKIKEEEEKKRLDFLELQKRRAKAKEGEFLALVEMEEEKRNTLKPSSMVDLKHLTLNKLSEGVPMSEAESDKKLREKKEGERQFINAQLESAQQDEDDEKKLAAFLRQTSVKSLSGTIRGKRHGVRSVVGAFTQSSKFKSELLEKLHDEEKNNTIVLYITSVTGIRSTYESCQKMIKIFQLQGKKYRVKNIALDSRFAKELAERLSPEATVPQAFVNFAHLGDLERVTQLNESKKLNEILHSFETSTSDCDKCGGSGFYPCTWCFGSKKSIKTSFAKTDSVLKCTVCNEIGLQRCDAC